jgi:dTDP-4-dehydrorhamnose 3,5-epimerase
MDVTPVPRIAGAMLFTSAAHADERGFFCRTFDADAIRAADLDPAAFVQDSVSRSARGVIRGLHVRRGSGEAKLVRCSYGAIFDVIVDLRPGSPTYRNWESFELSGDRPASLYVPADVAYRIDRAHDPSEDVSVAFDDPDLAIGWPLPVSAMSRRDKAALPLAAALELLA